MRSFRFTSHLAIAMCAGALVSLATPALAADLMSACKSEISSLCSSVSKGRGRISLCLFAHGDKLSGACKTEVAKVSDSRAFKRYIPAGVRSLQGSEYEAGLRKACTSDANKFCPSVKIGNGRILACLYSRSNSVSKPCSSEAKLVLDQIK